MSFCGPSSRILFSFRGSRTHKTIISSFIRQKSSYDEMIAPSQKNSSFWKQFGFFLSLVLGGKLAYDGMEAFKSYQLWNEEKIDKISKIWNKYGNEVMKLNKDEQVGEYFGLAKGKEVSLSSTINIEDEKLYIRPFFFEYRENYVRFKLIYVGGKVRLSLPVETKKSKGTFNVQAFVYGGEWRKKSMDARQDNGTILSETHDFEVEDRMGIPFLHRGFS